MRDRLPIATLAMLTLLGVPFAGLVGSPTTALAQGRITLKRPVTVTLVPPGEIRADGSPQTLEVLVTDERGQLAGQASFRGSRADMGQLGDFTQIGPGVWTADYSVPQVTARYSAQLTIRAKVGREISERSFPLEVVPNETVRFAMQATPDRILLGTHQAATLVFNAIGGAGEPVDGLDLAVRSSVGTVGEVQALGNGAYVVQYQPPPDQRTPVLAVLSVVDLDRAENTYAFFTIPIVGAVPWRVDTGTPLTVVGMTLGERTFGPVTADEAGVAMVPIEVSPGIRTATAYALDAEGNPLNPVEVDLKVPMFERLCLAQPASEYPGDGIHGMPLYLFVVGEDGQPMNSDPPLQIDATAGAFLSVDRLAPGVFRAVYVPPAVADMTAVTVTAMVIGNEQRDRESVSFTVVPTLPAGFDLSTVPATVDGGQQSITLRARILGLDAGLPAGAGVAFATPDGVIPMEAALGDGAFEASFSGDFDQPVAVSAEVLLPASQRPVEAVVAWPVMDQVPVNGSTILVAMALDRFGLPVSGVDLGGAVLGGVGTVVGGGPTDHHGRAEFQFTATPLSGPALVEISDGEHRFVSPLWQADPLLLGLQLPLQGGARQAGMMQLWGKLRGRLLVGRGAPPPAGTEPSGTEVTGASGGTSIGTPAATGSPTGTGATGVTTPAATASPWGAAPSAGVGGATEGFAQQVRDLLATGDVEVRALRRVEVIAVEGGAHDIVVHYSHAATVVQVAGQKIQLSREEWFAGWAAQVGTYTRSSSFSSRDFVLVDDDSGQGLTLSTGHCRSLGGLSQTQRVDHVRRHAQSR